MALRCLLCLPYGYCMTIYYSIGPPIRNTYLERASGSYFVGPRPGQFLISGLLSTQGAETRFSYRYTSCCTSIFLIHGGYSQRVPRASNVLRSLFFVSFLFSSLRTSCGLRCRLLPRTCLQFLSRIRRVQHSRRSSIFIECCKLTLSRFARVNLCTRKKYLRITRYTSMYALGGTRTHAIDL